MSTPTSSIQIGVLAPLSRPGWVDAGRQLLAGLELAASEANRCERIDGKPVELVVRDTAADPARAVAAVDELAALGVSALAGEYHSVVARAAAIRASTVGLPFLCSSAVLDALTDEPTSWVARLSPPQSRGWAAYADFLLGCGHQCIAIAAEPSVYWEAGARILKDRIGSTGGNVVEYQARSVAAEPICDDMVKHRATALVILIGDPDLAASLVTSVRNDRRLPGILIGAPAGQPELSDWVTRLGPHCASIPFLRYLPGELTQLGKHVASALRDQMCEEPSFVAFEGYDTMRTLLEIIRSRGTQRRAIAAAWSDLLVHGTRGDIGFSSKSRGNHWQWNGAPLQIAERDPMRLSDFRVLRQI